MNRADIWSWRKVVTEGKLHLLRSQLSTRNQLYLLLVKESGYFPIRTVSCSHESSAEVLQTSYLFACTLEVGEGWVQRATFSSFMMAENFPVYFLDHLKQTLHCEVATCMKETYLVNLRIWCCIIKRIIKTEC